MKTKTILLATSGATVDGRVINPNWLTEMASSYNPATYSAPVNLEHIYGYTGEKPFMNYGVLLELSTEDVEVDFNGTMETRVGLYGVLDLSDEAKDLIAAGQKRHPSVEIHPNFADKGVAYCMGVAMTDTPASVATTPIAFNRRLPGAETAAGSAIEPASIFSAETPAETSAEKQIGGFFAKMTERLGLLPAPAPKEVETPAPETPAAFDAAAFTTELGETLSASFAAQTAASDAKFAKLTTDLAALTNKLESTQAPGFTQRPPAAGGAGDVDMPDF